MLLMRLSLILNQNSKSTVCISRHILRIKMKFLMILAGQSGFALHTLIFFRPYQSHNHSGIHLYHISRRLRRLGKEAIGFFRVCAHWLRLQQITSNCLSYNPHNVHMLVYTPSPILCKRRCHKKVKKRSDTPFPIHQNLSVSACS